MASAPKNELALPLAADQPPTCHEIMQDVLRRERGVRGLRLDQAAGVLHVTYDPARVSPKRVERLARQLGLRLEERYGQCSMRLHGMRCAECAGAAERTLRGVPGVVHSQVNPTAGVIGIEYEAERADLPTIAARLSRAGYEPEPIAATPAETRRSQDRERSLRQRMALATALCLLALVTAWAGSRAGLPRQAVLGLYLAAYLAGGFYSTKRVIGELRQGSVTVDLLMLAAALGAAAIDAWAEGAVLLFLFSLSNTLESFVLGRTRRAIEALMDLTPEEATVRRGAGLQRVPVGELRPGELVLVRPGERVPVDGVLRAGSTAIDQSPMTGESIPVEKAPGDQVFAGTLNQQGAIDVEVVRLASDTTLARMVRLVSEAQAGRARSQRFTDWFGQRYTFAVLGAAALTLLVPLLWGSPFAESLYRAMTVLVVASPCAVVISIPATILAAITSAARGGVLVKGGAHLETLATIKAVCFDKTGTLTVGRPEVVEVEAAEGQTPESVLRLAASVERLSEHPLARAVVRAASDRGIEPLPAEDAQALVGSGIEARVEGRVIRVGKVQDEGAMEAALGAATERLRSAGQTVVFVAEGERILGLLAIADTLRPGAAESIERLRGLGVQHMCVLTGDNALVARAIAEPLGLEFGADLLPEAKLARIRQMRERYGPIAMVGDGINDAPSLAVADVGVSLGGAATDVALETADVVLLADDLRRLPAALELSRRAGRVIRQNLVFAFAVMLGLLGVTYFATLPLPLAVLGHEGSTVLVILNGLRLLAPRR
jgi:Cd2+/Zn2+-exporting ATPase